jgi:hypothetical protein
VTKLLVAALALIGALAAADAIRDAVGEQRTASDARSPEGRITRWRIDRGPTPCRSLVPGACGRYLVLDGGVTRDGRPYLRRGMLDAAFPGGAVAGVQAYRVADSRDGTLAVAVRDGLGRGAVEVWRRRLLVGSFRVPPRAFAAGLGWTPGGDLVAMYPRRGAPVLYDLEGTRVAEVRWERRPG